MGYREDIKIDKYNLDEELIRQPQKFLDFALLWNEAADQKEKMRTRLDLEKAKAELRIRKELSESEEKITEKVITATVLKDKKVKRANKKYLSALKYERTLSDVKTAFRQRKSMLEKLVDLNLMLRFSEPKESRLPKDQQEAVYQMRKRNIVNGLKGKITRKEEQEDVY